MSKIKTSKSASWVFAFALWEPRGDDSKFERSLSAVFRYRPRISADPVATMIETFITAKGLNQSATLGGGTARLRPHMTF